MPASRAARSLVMLVALSAFARDAGAQLGQDAALAGTVEDSSGAVLAGVTVLASSVQLLGGPRATVTDSRGRYRFPVLAPGEYVIEASLAGFKTARLDAIQAPPGLALTVDIRLALESVAETVSVVARPAAIDVRSAASPAAIERVLIDSLPLSRDVKSYVNLAPGVTDNVAFGGSAGANPLTIDGASGNEPGWGSPTSPFARTWIEEVQFVGPGAQAQHGEHTGVVMNAVTRSGTNRFSGLGEYRTTRQSWTGNNRGDLPPTLAARFRPIDVVTRWEGIAQAGGPVIRDRLWFFAGGQRYRDDTRSAAFGTEPRAADEPIPSSTDARAIAKLTAGLPHAIRVEGFVARNVNQGEQLDAGPLVRREATAFNDRTDDLWNARVQWAPNARWMIDTRHGGNHRDGVIGAAPDRRDGPAPHVDLLTGVYSVNAPYYDRWTSTAHTTAASVTRYLDGGIGLGHDLKAGVEYERARVADARSQPGGRFYLDFDGQPYQVELWDGSTFRGRHGRTTIFVQDSWNVSARVTVDAGLRFDRYRAGPSYDAPYRTHSLAPRLGVAWAVGASHQTVLRTHYGRFHDPMVTSYYDFLDPLSRAPIITAEVVGPEQFSELYRSLPSAGLAIDPDIRSSYVEELLAGFERPLPGRIAFKAQYIHRRFEDTVSFIDTTTVWTPLQTRDPGPDGRAGTADDGGLVTIYNNSNPGAANRLLTNPPQAYRRYHAAQLIASRRATRGLAFQASYTWSRTRGNFNNGFSSNAANNDNGINGVFANPNRAINRDGGTGFDYTHSFKAFGAWQLPGAWNVSGVYRYESGKPWARLVTYRTGLNQGFEHVLAEPFIRRAPAVNTADVRIEKTLRLRGTTFGLYVDLFNVANAGVARSYIAQSGPLFAQPSRWLDPRTVAAGVRLSF